MLEVRVWLARLGNQCCRLSTFFCNFTSLNHFQRNREIKKFKTMFLMDLHVTSYRTSLAYQIIYLKRSMVGERVRSNWHSQLATVKSGLRVSTALLNLML